MPNWQKEFFKLAANMLDCLYNEINITKKKEDKVFNMVGYMDYSSEMSLILKEQYTLKKTKMSIL